jgi:hypothetical protein
MHSTPRAPGPRRNRPLSKQLEYSRLRPSKTYEFMGFGAMDVTTPYTFIGLGDMHGPRPYKFIGLRWAYISQTPVVLPGRNSAFRAGFWPDCYRENTKIGLWPAEGRPEARFWCLPGSSPAKIRPGRPSSGPEALSRNIEYHPQLRLRPKYKSETSFPSDPGRNRPKILDRLRHMAVRTRRRTPRGQGKQEQVQKRP